MTAATEAPDAPESPETPEQPVTSAEAPPERFPCPCCGYGTFLVDDPTLPLRTLPPCPVCGWVPNRLQQADPEVTRGPNLVCLREARDNFLDFGAIDRRFAGRLRAPLPDEQRAW